MPGFITYIRNKKDFAFCEEERNLLVCDEFRSDEFKIVRRTVNKFLDDKVWFENDKYVIVTEGVILNRVELEAQYFSESFVSCIIKMYEKNGETFFKAFRGSFSGLLYDKTRDEWIIFTDHIGDKQVFFNVNDSGILIGSEMSFMVKSLKKNGIQFNLNKTGAYLTLIHGFAIEDHTLINEIRKLSAGHYIKINKTGLSEIQYHRFSNKPNDKMSLSEAIEGIDSYFRKAVKLQFEKDKEYGYKHLTCLSGGLDSRMTVWVAHEMGYTNQLNTTFSQSKYLDFTIAQQIATDLKHDFLFKSLDHGNFIKEIDKISELTYGSVYFFGLAHGKSMYDMLNFEPYGLVHTGMIGDAIIGTFFKTTEYNNEVTISQGAYTNELPERLSDYGFQQSYENEEIFCLYTRAFTGANMGMMVFQEHTEAISPFCDVDFLEFCYSIPLKWRYNHKIYFDWILQKYPKAADYIWERIQNKITEVKEIKYVNIFGKKVQSHRIGKWLIGAVKRRLPAVLKGKETVPVINSWNMNPLNYWLATNADLRNFLEDYYEKSIEKLTDEELKRDCMALFSSKNQSVRMQVMTLLSAINIINVN